MLTKTFKKLGLPILALAGLMMFAGAPKADAAVRFGIGIGVPYGYSYPYAYGYPGYYPYAYPYAYGYGYPYYGGVYGGWGGGYLVGPGRCCGRDDHGHDARGGRGGRAPAYRPAPAGRSAPSIPGRSRGR